MKNVQKNKRGSNNDSKRKTNDKSYNNERKIKDLMWKKSENGQAHPFDEQSSKKKTAKKKLIRNENHKKKINISETAFDISGKECKQRAVVMGSAIRESPVRGQKHKNKTILLESRDNMEENYKNNFIFFF